MLDFSFRPLTRADFPLLSHWLEQPHVARWWDDDPTPAGLEADYGDCIDGTEPAEVFVAWCDGRPVGLVQRLRLHDYPQYVAELETLMDVPVGSCSIDYLVGEAQDTGRGLGTRMIAAFVRQLWLDWPAATRLIVPVHAENIASWRALERAGFTRACSGALTPDNLADSRDHHLYTSSRA